MGGIGSGSYGSGRRAADSCKTIDVNMFNRKGALKSGVRFTVDWTNGDSKQTIGVRSHDDMLELGYTITNQDTKDSTLIHEQVYITWTKCNYGGERPWFECPKCFNRVGKLYMRGFYFRCRECHNLTYNSCLDSGDFNDQAIARVARIKRKMGARGKDTSMMAPIPDKPKGMHWKTYYRFHKELMRAEQIATMEFSKKVHQIVKRIETSETLAGCRL